MYINVYRGSCRISTISRMTWAFLAARWRSRSRQEGWGRHLSGPGDIIVQNNIIEYNAMYNII